MQIRVERFLAITALLASTTVLGSGCVTEDEDGSSGGSGGLGGSGASSGGSAGASTGGTAGSAGASTGGTAGISGSGGASGSAGSSGDAGVECLGDTTTATDAGAEGFYWCATLPYVNTTCPSAEGAVPLGLELCDYMDIYGRDGVVEELVNCLAAINEADQCGQAHNDKVQDCVETVFPLACTTPPITLEDGGTYDFCGEVAAACPAQQGVTDGITEAQCLLSVSPFTDDGQIAIGECWNNTDTGDCAADFETCVFNF